MQIDDEFLKNRKEKVKNVYMAEKENYERFHACRKFLYYSTLSEDEIAVLDALQKPTIEFNVLEAFVSRLMGEFSANLPNVSVTNSELVFEQVQEKTRKTIQNYLLYFARQGNQKGGFGYKAMEDCYSGGFSVVRISHDYASDDNFNVILKVDRVYDPTLCGFDLLAKRPDKSDGQFCFEFYPKTEEEFKKEYPNVSTSGFTYCKDSDGFNWSYRNSTDKYVLICDFYEKVKIKTKIVQLSNGEIIEKKEYENYVKNWNMSHKIEQVPVIVNERNTFKTKIMRTAFIENQILFTEELKKYPGLPLIYFDGNGKLIRKNTTSPTFWMTRPYIYNAIGVQKLKTFAGQTLANEIENMVQHKFMIAKEGIAAEYTDALKDIQKQSVIVYNAYKDDDPEKPVPKPDVVPRVGAPPELLASFQITNQEVQNILGSYDAALGINDNQLSGVAIENAATQSNAVAMPYIHNFMQSLTSVFQFLVDMMPYYMNQKRFIPTISGEGLEESVLINDKKGINFDFKPNSLKVKVSAAVNYKLQQKMSLEQINVYSKSFPMFAALMNDPRAINVLLDNMDFNGIDTLKTIAPEVIAKQAQQAQQAQMQNPQVQKNMLKAQELQQKNQEMMINAQFKQQEQNIAQQDLVNDSLRIMLDAKESHDNLALQHAKAQVEKEVHLMNYDLKKNNNKNEAKSLVDNELEREERPQNYEK